MIEEKIFKVGAKWRNPRLFTVVTQLLATDFATQEELSLIQVKKLQNLFTYHKKYSKFYKSILPDNENDAYEALFNLPILGKEDLLENHDLMQTYENCGKSFFAETSGSSGQPFSFRKDLAWDTAHRASIIRGYTWHDISPWERNGYFWGYNFNTTEKLKTKVLDSLQNRFRVFSYDKDELAKFLNKMKNAIYIHGYSSMIYEVAQLAESLGFGPTDFPKLKMIKGTSEKIYDYYQQPVLNVFGRKIISEYGSAEGGIHAFECSEGSLHVNEENVILEEHDGELIVTNLNAFSIPIIRYRIGDAIKIDHSTRCSCGRQSRIVSEVLGRTGKKIVGINSTYPSLTLYYVFKNISEKHKINIQYQGFQNAAGKLEIRIPKALTDFEKLIINEQCKMYFRDDLIISFQENVSIHSHKSKLKDFVTSLE